MKFILMILGVFAVFFLDVDVSFSQTTGDPPATPSVLKYWRVVGIENIAWCETKKDDFSPVIYSIKITISKPERGISHLYFGDDPLPENEIKLTRSWECLAEEGLTGDASPAFKNLYNQLKLSKTNKRMVYLCGRDDEFCGAFVFSEAKILGYRFYKNSDGVWQKELIKE